MNNPNLTKEQNEELNSLKSLFSPSLKADIEKFWKWKKDVKYANKETIVRKEEDMSKLMQEHLDELAKIDPSKDKYVDFYIKFALGKTDKNSFGKKLYFKKASDEEVAAWRSKMQNTNQNTNQDQDNSNEQEDEDNNETQTLIQ